MTKQTSPGNSLHKQCAEIRKERKGDSKRRKKKTSQGDGVDVRGLTVHERSLLYRIKFGGWL
mgnify:CR=1 FL=1